MPRQKKQLSPKEFTQLKRLWYKKLKNSGFKDAEREDEVLHSYSTVFYTSTGSDNHTQREGKAEYYRLASHFLNEHAFKSELEKVIWEYHANGLSIRNIVKALKSARIRKNRDQVWTVVDDLRTKMKNLYKV